MTTLTIPLARWEPTTSTAVLLGISNRQFATFTPDMPLRPWSLGGTDDAIRFEVRPGDRLRVDMAMDTTPKERSEIGTVTRFGDGVPVDISWTLDLQAPARLTSKWTVLGQMHENGYKGPPPLALAIVDGDRWQLAARALGRPDRYLDVGKVSPTSRFRLRFVGGRGGHVTLWIDGVQVADVAGPIGADGGGFYWKLGIYRYAAPETVVATYRDLRIASGDMATETLRPTVAYVKGRVRIAARATSRVRLYDDGHRIAGPIAVGIAGFVDVAAPTAPGIHYLSAGGNEIVIARGTAADLWPLMDRLAAMRGLAAVQVTDAPVFDLPGTTDPKTVIAAYAKPLVLVGAHQFRKRTWFRTLLFDERGAKVSDLPGGTKA